ncbi:hypothetical protein [Streptomyces anulatus]|uniref:hypothetical protein n=1 Tax=Streptomyces anulatus TaxID=1892 RepID=UPI003439FA31
MALPANYSTVLVFGRYIDFAGAPAQGTVTFEPSLKYVKDPSADVLILSTALVATLDGTGAFSIEIPATDDPDVTPSGFTWNVTEHLNGRTWRTFSISVPQDTPAPGIDLVTVAPVLPADQVSNFVTSVDGQTGDVNLGGLYAPLDDGGKIPLDTVPEIVGGVLSVNGASGVLLIGAADIGALPVSGGALSGPLTLSADPTDPFQAATKAYVDAAVGGVDVPVASVNGQVGAVSLTASGLGALVAGSNLSDVANSGAARTNLGLAPSATAAFGSTAGTVAAGDDARITGAAQKATNLSDLGNISSARANLGLGGAAVLNVGTGPGDVSAGDGPASAVGLHIAASDPHGDRSYADGKFLPLTGGTVTGGLTVTGTTQSATVQGSAASGGNLALSTTSHSIKGKVLLGSGGIQYDETVNGLAINTTVAEANGIRLRGGDVFVESTSIVEPTHLRLSNEGISFEGEPGSVSNLTSIGVPSAGLVINGNVQVNGAFSTSGAGSSRTVRKTADQSVTSSTTLVNDSHLVLPVVANATYTLFLMCVFSGGTTGDIKFSWGVPSGTVLRWVDQTGTSGLAADLDVYSAPGGTTQVGLQIWATVVTSGTAGNIQFRWAQNASDATATIVRANSQLCLDRVA